MQIVIDIPEDVIEDAKSNPNYYPTYLFEMIWIAITNSTPLPKGHGRLGDLNVLKELMQDEIIRHGLNEYGCIGLVNLAPTIIEAESEA